MKTSFKRAIARITASRPDGIRVSGTGFLVSERHALTAFHVVGSRRQSQGMQAPALFEGVSLCFETAGLSPMSAVVPDGCCDLAADWALLELETAPRGVTPMGLGTLGGGSVTNESAQVNFESWGFPMIATAATGSGVTLDGRIQDATSEYQ